MSDEADISHILHAINQKSSSKPDALGGAAKSSHRLVAADGASNGGAGGVRYYTQTSANDEQPSVELNAGGRHARATNDDEPEATFTVEEAVNALGFGAFQIKLSILTGIAWMADAMEMMILTILAPALHCDWWLSSWQLALLTTVVFGGMMASSAMWGNICDKYGRRVGLIASAAMTFYFGLLSSLAPTFPWMLILRGLTGFGIGGVPQSVVLYAEFLPSKYRARCIVLIELFWALGACLEVAIAYLVMDTIGWRALLALSAIPCAVFCVLCVWLPESARYHVACGQTDLAYATIKRIADDNGMPMLLGRLVASGDGKPAKKGRFADLFAVDMRATTGLLWVIWCANAFCYYGLVLFTTKLYETGGKCHGGGGSLAADATCHLTCRRLSGADYRDLLYTTFAEFPGLLITAVVIERLGRRTTIGAEFLIYAVFTFMLYACWSRTLVTLWLFVARGFISGAFQAAYVYTPEVYPTTTRAMGLGACSGMARVGAIITPFIAQVAADYSLFVPITVYGVTAVVGAVAAFGLPIETKGRVMKD